MTELHRDAPGFHRNGKGLADVEARLSTRRSARPFFCRSCGTEKIGSAVPVGWYALTRHTGNPESPSHRLGLYCSLKCFLRELPRLAGNERELGDEWAETTARYRLPLSSERSARQSLKNAGLD